MQWPQAAAARRSWMKGGPGRALRFHRDLRHNFLSRPASSWLWRPALFSLLYKPYLSLQRRWSSLTQWVTKAVMSHIVILEILNTLNLLQMYSALQDPVSWGDVANFDMSEVVTPPRHNQVGFASLQRERTIDCPIGHAVSNAAALSGQDKNCTPFVDSGVAVLTPISSSKPTQISVWRRRRKERGEMSPLCDRTGSSFLENISNSPKKTPTKSLPFTPSRVNEVFFLFVNYFTKPDSFCSWWNVVAFCHVTFFFSSSVYLPRFATYQEPSNSLWTALHSPRLLFVAKGVSSTRHSTKRPHPSTRKRMTGKKILIEKLWCALCSTRIIMLLNCQSLYTASCILCIFLRSRTPTFRKAVTIPTPRTPTPFKNALAAQEKMHGPLKMEVRAELHLCVTVALPFTWFRAATDGSARLVLATAAGVSGRRHTRSSEAGNRGWHL